jgi:hypothetical protein
MQLNYNYSGKKEVNEAKSYHSGICNLIGAVAFKEFLVLSTLFSCLTYEVVTQVIIGFRYLISGL